MMRLAVIGQRHAHLALRQDNAVELRPQGATADAIGVLDVDVVDGRTVTEDDAEIGPSLRDAGIEQQRSGLDPEP
jgi:hypothetical protein